MADVSAALIAASERLRDRMAAICETGCLRVEAIYDPLVYAWEPHRRYLERYGAKSPRQLVMVGMNPGPWGMGQTGVPFGDPERVRDWMAIGGRVDQPPVLHPKRPVRGFESPRREGSGQRLYGWAQDRWKSADRFFSDVFVTNYCPLLLIGEGGKNVTPADLPRRDLGLLYEACDEALVAILRALQPEVVVGVGKFAQLRVEEVARTHGFGFKTGGVLHPSPANPQANREWAQRVERELAALGVQVPG